MYGPSIFGKNILVTGGGGSIGKELCKKIIKLKAAKLIIIDKSEINLFEASNALGNASKELNSKTEIFPILGSVCDEKFLNEIFKTHKINNLFHAAAYKHVSIVEKNPINGLKNNIFSTNF